MSIEFRPIVEEEFPATMRMADTAFGSRFDESRLEETREWYDLSGNLTAFDGGEPVGIVQCATYEMNVPGGRLPNACIGPVAVLPTHRRRGLMTELMRRQLQRASEEGLAASSLDAAESNIYGRFGYGMASSKEQWSIERQHTGYGRQYDWDGRVKLVQGDEVRSLFPGVWRRSNEDRPGVIQPPALHWKALVIDRPEERTGANANFYAVYEEGGEVDGYAIYRMKGDTLIVNSLMSATDAAYTALWRYCLDVDLRTRFEANGRPVDDPLPWILANPRMLERKPADGAWLRLVDVPKALSSRTYARDGRLVFEVADSFCPWNAGRYELDADRTGAECGKTSKDADLALSAAELAAAYLGGTPFTPLARAGRVEELTAGALDRADSMFATRLKPWSPFLR